MRFLKGIEKFRRYNEEIKEIVVKPLINEGVNKELIDKIKNYEKLLGIKEDKLEDTKSINIRNTLLKYLDYLDYYIMNHFLVHIYDINTDFIKDVKIGLNVSVDFVTLLYKMKYPNDENIDPIKYTQVREIFEKTYM
jgi:hypothetical protein